VIPSVTGQGNTQEGMPGRKFERRRRRRRGHRNSSGEEEKGCGTQSRYHPYSTKA
jgi:hypothetical protein